MAANTLEVAVKVSIYVATCFNVTSACFECSVRVMTLDILTRLSYLDRQQKWRSGIQDCIAKT